MGWIVRCLRAISAVSVAIILSACASTTSQEIAPQNARSSTDIYRSLNGASFIPCYKYLDVSGCGENLYSRPTSAGLETGMPVPEASWYDCSDDDYSCVGNPVYLMAVPKTGLTRGLVYETHGSELTVLKCFEAAFGEPGECQTALISSTCVGSCKCRPEQAPRFGVLFYYAEDVGISAILFTLSIEQMGGAIPERSWSLIADKGFLKGDFNLRKTENPPCHWS